jgi:DNA polymerase III subunit epsilon
MSWVIIILLVAFSIYFFFFRTKSKKTDLSLLPEQFVVIDVETTGLDPNRHEIIEIAAIKANRDSNMHDYYQALVESEKKIPKRITEITGITPSMIEAEGVKLEEAINGLLDFAGDLRLVFFNAPFDLAFLKKAVKRFERKLNNPHSCALDMARRAWPGRDSYRLTDLARSLDTAGSHRALKDCELTMSVYGAAAIELGRID